MKERICKTCGKVASPTEKICSECGCRLKGETILTPRLMVCLGAILIIAVLVNQLFLLSLNTYIVPSNICSTVFGETPQEFCDKNGADTVFSGYLKSSKVDRDGSLVVRITDEQKQHLQEQCILEIAQAQKEEIDFSKKRDKITVKVYREDLESKLWIATDTTRFCFFYQMLNGENINDINVNLTVLDAGTGSVLSSQDWPKTDNNITVKFDKETITSLNDK